MKKNKHLFGIGMFVAFSSYSLFYTQIIPFLTQLGYSPTQRGYVISVVSLVSIVGQIILGYLSDRFGTVKRLFLYVTFIMVMCAFLAFTTTIHDYWFHLFVIGLGAGMTRILANLFETWVMEINEIRPEFGYVRAYGSFGWAIFALFSGFLITSLGYRSLAIVIGLCSLIVVGLSTKMADADKVVARKVALSDVQALLKNKDYMLLIVIYFIALLVYNADAVTITDYMVSMGGTERTIGVKWFVQAMFEVPTLFIGATLIRRIGAKKMMFIGSVVLGLRLFASGLVSSNGMIILIATSQALTYPFILLSQKDLVFKELPDNLKSTGQLLAISLSVGFAGVITPILSGFLIEHMAIQSVLMIFGSLMVFPIILLYFVKEGPSVNI